MSGGEELCFDFNLWPCCCSLGPPTCYHPISSLLERYFRPLLRRVVRLFLHQSLKKWMTRHPQPAVREWKWRWSCKTFSLFSSCWRYFYISSCPPVWILNCSYYAKKAQDKQKYTFCARKANQPQHRHIVLIIAAVGVEWNTTQAPLPLRILKVAIYD